MAPFLGGMPVPQVSVQDAVRQMPRDMVQEVVMQVPVPPVQAVEGATVVPQVQIAAKIDSFEVRVPVPQVSVQEGVSQMPKRKRNRERKMKRQRQRQKKELVFFWRGAKITSYSFGPKAKITNFFRQFLEKKYAFPPHLRPVKDICVP